MTTNRHSPFGDAQRAPALSRATAARAHVSGDELFVPAAHGLVADQRVNHAAFRLWCVLHRLWFLREPPAMEVLQDVMGTCVARNGSAAWQPATRRSIERWLSELEEAGWLVWTRRATATQRYHLRTSARSASDGAVLGALRALLNSGKATLDEVHALLARATDATTESHDPIVGSQQEAIADRPDTAHTTPASHDPTPGSQPAIPASHDPTPGSHPTTTESHVATPESHQPPQEPALMRQRRAPTHERLRPETRGDSTPPPAGGGGGGATVTEQFLIHQGFSVPAAQEFRDLDCAVAQAEVARRQALNQGPGAIVQAWRRVPPSPPATPPLTTHPAVQAKQMAVSIAPPDANAFEIQALALDLEDGVAPDTALVRLADRRAHAAAGAP